VLLHLVIDSSSFSLQLAVQAGLKELAGAFLSVLANPNVQVLWVGIFMGVGVVSA